VYAPPATTFRQVLHSQIPTHVRFTESFPQKAQWKVECWETSIFRDNLRRVAPYRVPYFPVIPTFFVRFPILYYLCCRVERKQQRQGELTCYGDTHRLGIPSSTRRELSWQESDSTNACVSRVSLSTTPQTWTHRIRRLPRSDVNALPCSTRRNERCGRLAFDATEARREASIFE
jgi:hypothetical protein